MTLSDYLAIGASIISIVALIIASKTKKYELSCSQRSQVLSWYQETLELLVSLRLSGTYISDTNKLESLAKLSALIECGRFYFPNIDKNDSYGMEKPLAYRGYRNITLDYLVFFYDIVNKESYVNYSKHLEHLQKLFTSRIFEVLSPNKHNKEVKKHAGFSMSDGKCIHDYLALDNPEDYSFN